MDAIKQPWFKNSYYAALLTQQGKRRLVYDHGLPFRQLLADNMDDLMDRISQKKASLVVIDGGVGEGKTTLGVHLADYVNIKFGRNGPIDFRSSQMAMGGKDFGEKLLACHTEKFLVIIYDEAGDMDKKTTLSRFNRNLMRIFEMYRGFRILVILCLPRFYKLENELLDLGIWRMTIHCEDRSLQQGNFRVFDIEQTYYIKHHAVKIVVKPKCYDFGMSNFNGHFLDLPKERSDDLDKVSIAAKRKETKKTVYDVKGRVTVKEIASHFGVSLRWVRLKLRELQDREELDTVLFDRKKWYKKDVLDMIDELENNKD